MSKHKTHYGECLNLNWQSSVALSTRVVVGSGTLTKLSNVLSQLDTGKKVLLLKPPGLFVQEVDRIKDDLHKKNVSVHVLEVPDGETCKSTDHLLKIWNILHELKFSRKDTVVAFGGGTVTDIAGFAASSYLRGINFVTVPTTLLAQVDAAIGGKTGINFHNSKNLIGSYYFAKAIIIDPDLLATLSTSQFSSGLAEVIKYALLEQTITEESQYTMGTLSLLQVLENLNTRLTWDSEFLPGVVISSIKMKLAVVAQDPREKDLRRCLNLGHTLGHALESISDFSLSHGESVAIGIVFALHVARARKQIGDSECTRAVNLLKMSGLPVRVPSGISIPLLLEYLFRDKKREGEAIKMILPSQHLGKINYNELLKGVEIEERLTEFLAL